MNELMTDAKRELFAICGGLRALLEGLQGAGVRFVPAAPAPEHADAGGQLETLRQQIGDCTRCPLAAGRSRLVFGEGDPLARLVLVGEGPDYEEDRTGRPFVGPAGQLLDRILQAMGLTREQVYISNAVKCRPPENHTPTDEEIHTCGQFLEAELAILRPAFVLCLGGTAVRALLGTDAPVSSLRGQFFEHTPTGAQVMPTYHPAYLLRNEAAKKFVWQDVQKVMAALG